MQLRSRLFSSPFPQFSPAYRSFSSTAIRLSDSTSNASDKLFADAAREESSGTSIREKSAYLTFLENREENWTGEENIQDAVLRMLVDKHKPLRSGTMQSADQKLSRSPPRPVQTGSWATEPLLPSSENHRPWHTEYRVPSHVLSSVKLANIPPPAPKKPSSANDERARKQEKEVMKRTEQVGRLGRARESTLDYKLGLRPTNQLRGRPNPANVKGWAGLIEDKIEKARAAGVFNNVKGRGQPIVQAVEERNPFIAREEFLMNRIVRKNGAAPPWIELQAELDTAVVTLRELLRQAWIRRAILNLTTNHPPEILRRFRLDDVKSHRDGVWEKRETSYHDSAIEEVNSLVRKYNGIAPYAVRRPYYIRSVELAKVYEESAEEILRGLKHRLDGPASTGNNRESRILAGGVDEGYKSIRQLFLGWIDRILGRWRARRET